MWGKAVHAAFSFPFHIWWSLHCCVVIWKGLCINEVAPFSTVILWLNYVLPRKIVLLVSFFVTSGSPVQYCTLVESVDRLEFCSLVCMTSLCMSQVEVTQMKCEQQLGIWQQTVQRIMVHSHYFQRVLEVVEIFCSNRMELQYCQNSVKCLLLYAWSNYGAYFAWIILFHNEYWVTIWKIIVIGNGHMEIREF